MAGVDWQITPLGDCALVVHLGETADEDAFDRVQACAQALARAAEAGQLPGATELVPALVTVTVYFDLLRTSLAEMRVHVAAMLDSPHNAESWAVRPNAVPTVVTSEKNLRQCPSLANDKGITKIPKYEEALHAAESRTRLRLARVTTSPTKGRR